jgi:hypothetical protein
LLPGGLAVNQLRLSVREFWKKKKTPPEAASGVSLFGSGAPLRTARFDYI